MVDKRNKHAMIVGSAPCSAQLVDANLEGFEKIALHKAWQLRDDFDYQIALRDHTDGAQVPETYPARRIRKRQYKNTLDQVGGPIMTSASISIFAGFWAVNEARYKTISYFGCDLVYQPSVTEGRTHFYGVSDLGPAASDHTAQIFPHLRFARLFGWGLLHRVVLLNASALEGTKMCFPEIPYEEDREIAFTRVMRSPLAAEIIRHSGAALAEEQILYNERFEYRWPKQRHDPEFREDMEACMKAWEPVYETALELGEVLNSQ
ncbi:hypothetical protein [Halocynthiibacter sp.]|uniref:hypothetical protein n=1 Tax=Halocynthiibacter sp. TaxID=1979210 RepID=UPI003C403C4B